MSKTEELTKKLTYSRKNFWQEASKKEQKAAFDFSEGYKTFLDICKTERETIDFYAEVLKEKGLSQEVKHVDFQEKVYRYRGSGHSGKRNSSSISGGWTIG